MIVAIAFVNRSVNIAGQERISTQIQLTTQQIIETTSLEAFVIACLDTLTKEAINLSLSQGGNIYTYQDGISPINVDFIRFGTLRIPFSLSRQPLAWNFPLKPPPDYPLPRTYLKELSALPFFGVDNLPPLCDPSGPNAQGLSLVPCKRYGGNSIQEQIEVYIEKHIDACANFTEIARGFNVTPGEPNATLVFGFDDVLVNLDYPLDIAFGQDSGAVSALTFNTRLDVRLKKMYDLVLEYLTNERYKIFYNLDKEFNDSILYDNNIGYSRFCPLCGQGVYADLVRVRDEISILLDNFPMEFSFLIENRDPALEYIRSEDANSPYDIVFTPPKGQRAFDPGEDIEEVDEGDEEVIRKFQLTFSPLGVDPDDESNLTYTYSGWKEDYDEFFDLSCCRDYAKGSSLGVDCKDPLQVSQCVIRDPLSISAPPKLLSGSTLYRATGREAAVFVNLSDVGVHYVTITVEDRAGLKDWQNISILVADRAHPDLKFENTFMGDAFVGEASIEDPFVLDGGGSSYVFGDLTYFWSDYLEGFSKVTCSREIANCEQKSALTLPEEYDIKTIKDGIFSREVFDRHKPLDKQYVTHNVTLEVTDGERVAVQEIDVFQCLPFGKNESWSPKNYSDPENALWPYNDAFENPHVCCQDFPREINESGEPVGEITPEYGTYVPSGGAECYNMPTIYSSIPEFESEFNKATSSLKMKLFREFADTDDTTFQNVQDTVKKIDDYIALGNLAREYVVRGDIFSPYSTLEGFADVHANKLADIFAIDFTRTCSGNRGNTCTGPAILTFTWIAEDVFHSDWEDGNQRYCRSPFVPSFVHDPPTFRTKLDNLELRDLFLYPLDETNRTQNFQNFYVDFFDDILPKIGRSIDELYGDLGDASPNACSGVPFCFNPQEDVKYPASQAEKNVYVPEFEGSVYSCFGGCSSESSTCSSVIECSCSSACSGDASSLAVACEGLPYDAFVNNNVDLIFLNDTFTFGADSYDGDYCENNVLFACEKDTCSAVPTDVCHRIETVGPFGNNRGCNADLACVGNSPNSVVEGSIYCDANCNVALCEEGYMYDEGIGECSREIEEGEKDYPADWPLCYRENGWVVDDVAKKCIKCETDLSGVYGLLTTRFVKEKERPICNSLCNDLLKDSIVPFPKADSLCNDFDARGENGQCRFCKFVPINDQGTIIFNSECDIANPGYGTDGLCKANCFDRATNSFPADRICHNEEPSSAYEVCDLSCKFVTDADVCDVDTGVNYRGGAHCDVACGSEEFSDICQDEVPESAKFEQEVHIGYCDDSCNFFDKEEHCEPDNPLFEDTGICSLVCDPDIIPECIGQSIEVVEGAGGACNFDCTSFISCEDPFFLGTCELHCGANQDCDDLLPGENTLLGERHALCGDTCDIVSVLSENPVVEFDDVKSRIICDVDDDGCPIDSKTAVIRAEKNDELSPDACDIRDGWSVSDDETLGLESDLIIQYGIDDRAVVVISFEEIGVEKEIAAGNYPPLLDLFDGDCLKITVKRLS